MDTEGVVAVDLDGVLYEWDRTAQYMLRTYRGQAQLHQPSESWDWIMENVAKKEWKWLWNEGVTKGLFRYGHMVTGARVGLEDLVAEGYKLTIVTHRPSRAVMDTVDWVSLYLKGIPLHGLHILSNGESKTVVEADILIDDKPENLIEWRDAGRTAVQFVRNWNKNYLIDSVLRAEGWKEVVNLLA